MGGAAALALALACTPIPGWALSFAGSFEGTARATTLPFGPVPDHPVSFYDGAAVTGTFAVHIPDADLADARAHANVSFGSGWSIVTYDIGGKSGGKRFTYRGDPSDALEPGVMQAFHPVDGSPAQRVVFRDVFSSRFDGATFQLDAAAGTLFDGEDLSTLRIAPGTVSSFDTFFSNFDERLQVEIDITGFTLGTLAAPVPEPATGALALAGLVVLSCHQRRALRTASRKVPSCTLTVSSITLP